MITKQGRAGKRCSVVEVVEFSGGTALQRRRLTIQRGT